MHPHDAFMNRLDKALTACLKQLAPCIGKPVPFGNGETARDVIMTPQELSERMITHLNTHLRAELAMIDTGEDLHEASAAVVSLHLKYADPRKMMHHARRLKQAGDFQIADVVEARAMAMARMRNIPESDLYAVEVGR